MQEELSESSDPQAIWPENWAAVCCYAAMQTQWRFSPVGRATGFDYAAIPVVMAMHQVADDDKPAVFKALQTMELETLRIQREKL